MKFTVAGTKTTVPSNFLALVILTVNSCGITWWFGVLPGCAVFKPAPNATVMLPGVLSLACTAGLVRQSARTETAAADALRLFMSEILSLASGLAMVEVTLYGKIAARKRAERQ